MLGHPFVGRPAFPRMADDIGVALIGDFLADIDVTQFKHLGRLEQRFLAGIIFDDVGKMGGQRAIVGQVRAKSIGDGERSLANAGKQTGNAKATGGIERDRVEEGSGKTTQDHIDRFNTGDGLEKEPAVEHDEITALHDGDTHLSRQGGMIEIVVHRCCPARAGLRARVHRECAPIPGGHP